MRALHGEFVRGADKGQAGEPGDLGCGGLGETRRCVDPRADGRAAQRKTIDALERILDPFEIIGQHAGIARPFLPERERRGVLHVGPADLDDIVPLRRLRCDGIAQRRHRGDQTLLGIDRGGNVHRRGKVVVRRLRHVDVIVRMHRRFAAKRRARELAASVRDHLVDVHVELGAAAGHPDVQREHVVMLAGQDFVADLGDQVEGLVVQTTAGVVRCCRAPLQDRIGGDHLARHQVLPDAEVLERALRLRSPEPVRGNLDLAEAVGFDPDVAHAGTPVAIDMACVPSR